MEVIHQGYLLCNSTLSANGGTSSGPNLQKVYAVLTADQLVCYSENPALQHFSKVNIVSSFDLKYARVNDTTESNRPKSFEVFSTRDNSVAEFICATNSVKFQWVKQLQVQSCSATSPPNRKSRNSEAQDSGDMTPSGTVLTRPTIRAVAEISATHQPNGISRLAASRNLAAKVLTPVPRISYNTSMLDQSSGNLSGSHDASDTKFTHHNVETPGVKSRGVIDDHPRWIPNNFGNKKHSSLAMSPTSTAAPRAHSTGRLASATRQAEQAHGLNEDYYPDRNGNNELQSSGPHQRRLQEQLRLKSPATAMVAGGRTPSRQTPRKAEYDVLASRAAPNRSKSATPVSRPQGRDHHNNNIFHAQQQQQQQQQSPRRSGRNVEPEASATPSHTHHFERSNRGGAYGSESAGPGDISAPSAREHTKPVMTKAMSDMTVSEIRAALLSMPAVVRDSLMDTPQGSKPASVRPTRRGSYDESPAYTPSAHMSHNTTNISHSMQEEYFNNSRRRNSEQYDRFMGDGYPAVGEFYPAEQSMQRASEQHAQSAEESSAEEDEEKEDGEGQDSEEMLPEESGSEYGRGNQVHRHLAGRVQQREDERRRERSTYTVPQEYLARHGAEPAADDSDYLQEYGHRVPELDEERFEEGEEGDYYREGRYGDYGDVRTMRPAREIHSSQTRDRGDRHPSKKNGGGASFRSVPPPADYSDGEERRGHVKAKAKLPDAAKRSSGATTTTFRQSRRDDTSDRESLIPRRIDTSPRPGSSLRRIDTGHAQSDGYDSSVSPAARSKNGARSASAQRVPARGHKPPGASSGAATKASASNRAASTGSATERTRYLPEEERKQALDWSRKQAYDRKLRANFSGSPLRAASPAVAPAALKLKYRSFNNSVEKDFTSSLEIAETRPGQKSAPPAAEPKHHASVLEKGAAVQEAMGAIARSRARAQQDEQNVGKSKNKSDHIAYSANAFSKKPESFFAFRDHHRAGGNPPVHAAQDPSHHKEPPAARKVSPPAKARPVPVDSPAVATDSFIRSNQQMLASYQSRRSPERTERAPVAKRDEQTMTNVAEWRRLTEWLVRIGMQRYIEVLRANGVSKLSLVELMQPEDMQQIGIAPADIDVIHSKVTEFTNRTRSFSEQVLNRGSKSPSPSPPTSHTGSAVYPAAVLEPVGSAAASGAGTRLATSQNNVGAVRRPSAPPPHLLTKHGMEKHLTPFAMKRQQNDGERDERNQRMDIIHHEEESVPEEVLESARVAAEEHIFSDVRQIRAELLRCFETGERELFFHAWKQVTLYMPDDCNTLNPQRPSMYNAKQVIEFHLHLHFAVFPITHAQGKKAEKQGKLALRRYLESIMLTSELDSLNQLNELSPRPPSVSEKLASPRSDEGHLFLETNLLNMTSGSIASPTTPFTRTREYAVYAGMVLVPDPQENIAFQALFQPQWMQSLKERLGQFLTLVSPNVEIVTTVSTAASSVVNAMDNGPRAIQELGCEAEGDEALSDDGSRVARSVHSVHSKVRNYLEPALTATAAPSQGRLDDFEIAFTSPINARHVDPGSPPHAEIQVDAIDLSSPMDLHISTNMLEDVVSPLEMSPSEADVPRKRMASTKLSDEALTMAKLTRIASPVSAVSSVISQLTDDDFPRSATTAAAATALRVDELQGVAPAVSAGKIAPGRKLKLKPFSATQKSAMQSQVDMYNKLLKHGAGSANENQGVTDDSNPEGVQAPTAQSATTTDSPPVFRTTRRATSSPAHHSKTPALNVGFGLKRRAASDAPAPDQQQQQQSLAAQVARYNKLLTAATGSAEEIPSPRELPSGLSQDATEEGLSAAEAEKVEEVLLEMQNIYSTSAEASIAPVLDNAAPLPDLHHTDSVEQKIELHEQATQPEQEVEVGVEGVQEVQEVDEVLFSSEKAE